MSNKIQNYKTIPLEDITTNGFCPKCKAELDEDKCDAVEKFEELPDEMKEIVSSEGMGAMDTECIDCITLNSGKYYLCHNCQSMYMYCGKSFQKGHEEDKKSNELYRKVVIESEKQGKTITKTANKLTFKGNKRD